MSRTTKNDRNIEKIENFKGGNGYIIKDNLISPEQLGDNTKIFAEITIPKGGEVGYHMHDGDAESCYVIAGKGIHRDGEEEYEVLPGDVVYCGDGKYHSLRNENDEDFKVVALVLNS